MSNYLQIKNKLSSHGLKLMTLEDDFNGTNEKSLIECSNGHQWLAKLSNVLDKNRITRPSKGCPQCAENNYIQESYNIAIVKKPHNHTIINSYLKPIEHKKNKHVRMYQLKCEFGHEYEKTNSKISHGCPECSKKTYIGQERVRLMFEKEFNHSFPTIRPVWLINPDTGRKLELDGYCEHLKLAFEYQGRQHDSNDTEFGGDYQKQKVRDEYKIKQCAEHGIKLIVIIQPRSYETEKFYASVVTQAALQQCVFQSVLDDIDFSSINDNTTSIKHHQTFKEYVESKGYSLLSDSVGTMEDELEFQCKSGHQFKLKGSTFKTMLNTAKYRNEPCLKCHHIQFPEKVKEEVTLHTCQQFAQSIGYTCLSKEYKNVNELMDWQCNHGHIFIKNYRSFQRSKTQHYCPECEKNGIYDKTYSTNEGRFKAKEGEINLNFCQQFAKEHELVCLSSKYQNVNETMKWQCKNGHVFEKSFRSFQRSKTGKYCPCCRD